METYNKCNVIMLPTKDISKISLQIKENELWKVNGFANFGYENQHLYLLSEEEIKELS